MSEAKTARDVIVAALTARHEELSGEASPRDFDGASQILKALSAAGFEILSGNDVAAVRANVRQQTAKEIRYDAVDEAVDGILYLPMVIRICEEAGR